jgi:hypothetical protein
MKTLTILIICMLILSINLMTIIDKFCSKHPKLSERFNICKIKPICQTPNILTGECPNPDQGGNL